MKQIVFIALLASFASVIFAQKIFTIDGKKSFSTEGSGMQFIKRAENNYLFTKGFNRDSKKGVDSLFFGDYNAKVEFLVVPSFKGPYGFRLIRGDSSDNSFFRQITDSLDLSLISPLVIEIKDISNWKEVTAEMAKKYPSKGLTLAEIKSTPQSEKDQIAQQNGEIWRKRREESLQLFEVRTRSFLVSDLLAKEIYKKIVSSINTFEPGGIPPVIADGESMTFRCVVGDELRTLTVHQPVREIGKLSGIFKQLIEDIGNNNLDESKYIELLK